MPTRSARSARSAGSVRHSAGCTVVEPGSSVTVPVRFKVLGKGLMESVEYGTGLTGEAPGKEGYGDSYHGSTWPSCGCP